jgi:hypothetical protein
LERSCSSFPLAPLGLSLTGQGLSSLRDTRPEPSPHYGAVEPAGRHLGRLSYPAGSPEARGREAAGYPLSKDGLTINGSRVQLSKTTKANLEKLLGPLERSLKLEIRRDPIGFWVTKGVRV